MKYAITRQVIGCKTQVSIEHSEFEAIRVASRRLVGLLQIEADYDILVGNYVDLEVTALSLAADGFVRFRQSRTDFDRDHRRMNRVIANLLSSARAYIDHTHHNVSSLLNCSATERASVRRLFGKEYADSLSYRVIEALRNYTQHCGLASQSFGYSLRWTGPPDDGNERLLCGLSVNLIVKEIRADGQFKTTVLDELERAEGDSVPLLPHIRRYVASLSSINEEIRTVFAPKKKAWGDTLKEFIARYRAVSTDGHDVGLAAVALREDGTAAEWISLGAQLQERVEKLQATNRKLVNLHKVQVIS